MYRGIDGRWRLFRRMIEGTRGVGTLATLVIGACLLLIFLKQGQDLIRSVGDETLREAGSNLVMFAVGVLFLGIQSWLWPRMIIEFNVGRDRRHWRPRTALVWLPRLLAIASFLLALVALLQSLDAGTGIKVALILLGAGLLLLLIKREDWSARLKGSIGRRMGAIAFRRWWVGACLVLALVLMGIASAMPVHFGHWLGAPAVVFIGIGFILPPLMILVKVGRGLRLPVLSMAVLWVFLLSLWIDNHAVGRRAFTVVQFSRTPDSPSSFLLGY